MIFIGLELTGLSLYVMTAFEKRERSSAEAGMKYFLFGSMASAFTLFGLSLVYGLTGTTSLAEIAQRLAADAARAAARRRNHHDPDRLRLQNCGGAVPSLGAGRLPGRAGFDGGVHRLWLEGRVLRRPWKNRARRLRTGAWQRGLARHGRRLDADPRRPRGAFDSGRKLRRARAKERAPAARLFRGRARRLHPARTGRRRTRRFFRDAFLHHDLCDHPGRRVRRRRLVQARNRWRRSSELRRLADALAACSPVAWRSSCFRSPDCRRSPDFSASSTSSARRSAPVEITASSGWLRSRSLAA